MIPLVEAAVDEVVAAAEQKMHAALAALGGVGSVGGETRGDYVRPDKDKTSYADAKALAAYQKTYAGKAESILGFDPFASEKTLGQSAGIWGSGMTPSGDVFGVGPSEGTLRYSTGAYLTQSDIIKRLNQGDLSEWIDDGRIIVNNITVHGSVLAEQELARVVRDAAIDGSFANVTVGAA